MSRITNSLLKIVQDLIGGSGGSGITTLDDESVAQVLPIVPEIARRSLTIGNVGGIFTAVLENVHSGADFEQSSVTVYSPTAAARIPPYPRVVGKNFDIWLLGCSLVRSVGTGGLTAGRCGWNPSVETQGLGIDDAGASVIATPIIGLAMFTSINADLSGVEGLGVTDQGLAYQPINLRLSKRATLVFSSEAAAAAEFQLICVMGLFPAGMGQDVVA